MHPIFPQAHVGKSCDCMTKQATGNSQGTQADAAAAPVHAAVVTATLGL